MRVSFNGDWETFWYQDNQIEDNDKGGPILSRYIDKGTFGMTKTNGLQQEGPKSI